jgi:hypothetical protein
MEFLIINPNDIRSKQLVKQFGDCLIKINIEEFHTFINRKPYLRTPVSMCRELEHFIELKVQEAQHE